MYPFRKKAANTNTLAKIDWKIFVMNPPEKADDHSWKQAARLNNESDHDLGSSLSALLPRLSNGRIQHPELYQKLGMFQLAIESRNRAWLKRIYLEIKHFESELLDQMGYCNQGCNQEIEIIQALQI